MCSLVVLSLLGERVDAGSTGRIVSFDCIIIGFADTADAPVRLKGGLFADFMFVVTLQNKSVCLLLYGYLNLCFRSFSLALHFTACIARHHHCCNVLQ